MEQLLLLVLFLCAGFAFARAGFAKSSDYKLLANFVYYVCLPCSILASFATLRLSNSLYLSIAALTASFVLSVLSSVLISRALRLNREVEIALVICGFFGNVVFFGFPFTESILGAGSLAVAGIYAAMYNLFVFAILIPAATYVLGKSGGGKSAIAKAFLNPCLLATLLGVVVFALSFDISSALPYVQSFSALTTPLSLIAVGLFLSDKLSVTIDRNLAAIVLAKCAILPVITAILLFSLGIWADGKELFLLSLMPIAITNFVIVDSLGLKLDKLVIEAIVATSIVSTVLVFALAAAGVF